MSVLDMGIESAALQGGDNGAIAVANRLCGIDRGVAEGEHPQSGVALGQSNHPGPVICLSDDSHPRQTRTSILRPAALYDRYRSPTVIVPIPLRSIAQESTVSRNSRS